MPAPAPAMTPRGPSIDRFPPAVFPSIFGLFGLGLAWRRGVEVFGLPAGIAELILGATSLLYLVLLGAYVTKVARRPAILAEDLRVLPGRAGLTTMSMAAMLLAAALTPYLLPLAMAVLVLALVAHLGLVVLIVAAMLRGPSEARQVTPVWHLTFVGPIVGALAAAPMGWQALAETILWITLPIAAAIWGASLAQFIRRVPPAPLRPLLAIHLAPASLLGSVALMTGQAGLGFALGLVAILLLAALAVSARWLTQTGFSPFWGSFTFPLAAFAGLMSLLSLGGHGPALTVLAGVGLVAATLVVPYVAARVLRLLVQGKLAVMTNAASV